RWLRRVLTDPEELARPGDSLPLSAIDGTTREGARVLASARRILASLGRGDDTVIALADTLDTQKIFAQTRFNGDGVVPAAVAGDDATKALIADIIRCCGSETDRSGEPGIDQARADAFFDAVERTARWLEDGGDAAWAASGDALEAVREKIDGYFMRCRLAGYSSAAAQAVNPPPEFFTPLAGLDFDDSVAAVEPLPLAAVAPYAALPLADGLNPAWTERMAAFRDQVVEPLLGQRRDLTEEQWADIKQRFARHREWLARRPDSPASILPPARILEIAASDSRATVNALIAEDKAVADEAEAIDDVARLLLLKRDLFRLVNNFVSFGEFYGRQDKAIFQAGTLYLDGRGADLCVRVEDPVKHAVLATLSRIFLVYCECRRRGSDEKQFIAAAFTAGDGDQLMVGRNGVFYDRSGRDWDATVVKIVEHPISIRQAFWSPYRQLARFVGEQIEKVAAAKAKAVQTDLQKAPAQAFDAGKFAGIFAALGLAVGAIGTAVASVVTGFLNLAWWQMPLALAGLVLAVSGPSMAIAAIKLRQRNLAPILDATGWAVNARARINIPFGGSLTALGRLPRGAQRSLKDPYAERRGAWGWWLAVAALAAAAALAWRFTT
ncbi:MAG: hypothetical protein AB1918_01355, partial [Pseudomonadota bacterium]